MTGGGFITLAATLSTTGKVPVAGLALLLGIDRFMSEARAITNLIGNGVATMVVARWEGALDLAAHARSSRRTRTSRPRSRKPWPTPWPAWHLESGSPAARTPDPRRRIGPAACAQKRPGAGLAIPERGRPIRRRVAVPRARPISSDRRSPHPARVPHPRRSRARSTGTSPCCCCPPRPGRADQSVSMVVIFAEVTPAEVTAAARAS